MHRVLWLVFTAALALVAADINEELIAAARSGDLAAVKTRLENGAALETKTAYGQTPLYLAAMNGHEQVVEFLLDKGANSEVRDTFYKFPVLGFVVMRKHYGVAKLLIAKGAGSADDNLTTVAMSGNADLVKAVLAKKPSQAALDKTYEMALERKAAAVADVLKEAGAKATPEVTVDPKVLESYVGTYKSEQFPLEIKVFVKEDKLHMQAAGQPEFAPKAKSPTVFEFARARLEVEFDSPDSFTLKQAGMNFKYKKAAAQ